MAADTGRALNVAAAFAVAGMVGALGCSGRPLEAAAVMDAAAGRGLGGGLGGGSGSGPGGGAGSIGCPNGGPGDGSGDTPAVRGFTRGDGKHMAVFRPIDSSDIETATGTPLANPVLAASGALGGSNPWAYRRHDGPDTIVYLDHNGHVHELGTIDFDFAEVFRINAPIAASAPPDGSEPAPDIIGYVRADNQSSALVYRGSNDHVIEIETNFAGQPPWLATDLTLAAGAPVTAPTGSAFPYVRSDGWNAIVYIGSDDHIHELARLPPSPWFDTDLHVASGETVVPSSDPWGYQRSDGANAVVFVGVDGNLREIALVAARWTTTILPASVPLGGPSRRPSGYVRADGLNAVVYVSNAASPSLRQLTLSGGAWVDEALLFGSCVTPLGQPFAHVAPGIRSSILFQGSKAGVVNRYELSQHAGSAWTLTAF
jgi:hypothetical protein